MTVYRQGGVDLTNEELYAAMKQLNYHNSGLQGIDADNTQELFSIALEAIVQDAPDKVARTLSTDQLYNHPQARIEAIKRALYATELLCGYQPNELFDDNTQNIIWDPYTMYNEDYEAITRWWDGADMPDHIRDEALPTPEQAEGVFNYLLLGEVAGGPTTHLYKPEVRQRAAANTGRTFRRLAQNG